VGYFVKHFSVMFVCRPLTLDYELWDQIRVDHVKQLANHCYNCDCAPHFQATSKLVS
uniref:Uncharacterized protein n=1 Tax=Amphimedon queenslandica TaxID=400682 RepID=A0A1X7VR52_AMPQE